MAMYAKSVNAKNFVKYEKNLARFLAFSNAGLFEGANIRPLKPKNQTSFVFLCFCFNYSQRKVVLNTELLYSFKNQRVSITQIIKITLITV